MNELTETEKAYIAGFFDGEGCISISKYSPGGIHKSPVYSLQVVVAQKGDGTIFELQELTGVGVVHNRKKYHSGTYEWRLNPKDAVELLEKILPYLRNKAPEAEIAIEYQSKQGHKLSGGKGWTVPPELIEERESYRLQLQALKGTSSIKRGRPKKNP